MLFNSFDFLVFLPIVFLLYWFVFRGRKWQNLFVVVASYMFYGWWDWHFLLLIALTSFCSYGSGLLLERYKGQRQRQKLISASNIVLNLSILGVFKYYNFFLENLATLFEAVGWHLDWLTINVILPVGISFYTFQALSYTIDVYRKKISATHDPVEFFAYISFFPQLVAGPIERATNLLPQFQQQRHFNHDKAVDGCRQMLWGFFKKMVIADNCATVVNQIWNNYTDETGLVLLIGAILFTFQIYCDFSGYSDIAIGCARLFGFDLKCNFNFPYFSRSIPEFWRRWHISLTTWFRDYIYIPLGGSRCSKWKVIRNILVVWCVSGLWHGANWTFICWGLYHALLLVVYYISGIDTKHHTAIAPNKLFPNWKELTMICFTFLLTVIGWIIFRAESLEDALRYIDRLCSLSLFNLHSGVSLLTSIDPLQLGPVVVGIIMMLIVEWLQKDKQHALQFSGSYPIVRNTLVRYIIYLVLLLLITGVYGSQSEFIYFQF